jgi:hypothetical protein
MIFYFTYILSYHNITPSSTINNHQPSTSTSINHHTPPQPAGSPVRIAAGSEAPAGPHIRCNPRIHYLTLARIFLVAIPVHKISNITINHISAQFRAHVQPLLSLFRACSYIERDEFLPLFNYREPR